MSTIQNISTDCWGHIFTYIDDQREAVRFLYVSKSIRNYILDNNIKSEATFRYIMNCDTRIFKKLYLYRPDIRHLDDFNKFKDIESIVFGGDYIEDATSNNKLGEAFIKATKILKSIKSLSISSDYIKNNHIKNLSNLTTLDISKCSYLTDDIFEHLSELIDLNIDECNKIHGTGFKYLKKLRILSSCGCVGIESNNFKYITGIKKLVINKSTQNLGQIFIHIKDLESLSMRNSNKVIDRHFKYLSNLKQLNIENCSVLTKNIFKYIKNIQKLNMKNTSRIKITKNDFKSLTKLQKLNIMGFKVKNIECGSINNLKVLKIRKDCISIVKGLKNIDKLIIEIRNSYDVTKFNVSDLSGIKCIEIK